MPRILVYKIMCFCHVYFYCISPNPTRKHHIHPSISSCRSLVPASFSGRIVPLFRNYLVIPLLLEKQMADVPYWKLTEIAVGPENSYYVLSRVYAGGGDTRVFHKQAFVIRTNARRYCHGKFIPLYGTTCDLHLPDITVICACYQCLSQTQQTTKLSPMVTTTTCTFMQ